MPSRVVEPSRCDHCAAPLRGDEPDAFCCGGCRRVHGMLHGLGLERYYALRDGAGVPVGEASERDQKWLEPMLEQVATGDALCRLTMDVQGIHCAACVWLIEELTRREPAAKRVVVNPTRGRIELVVDPGFDLFRWVEGVEGLGYLLGPALKTAARETDDLTLRMGISIALAMNTMMLALAMYLGLSEGPVYELARQITFALGSATVLVGGSWFVKSAWRAARQGLVHLDLPIAVGIVLAFAGSVVSFFTRAGADYFDTVAIFVALMLVGRWIQARIVARNRDRLLASDGVEGLLARRREGAEVKLVRCVDLVEGDELMLAPGDLVPVAAELGTAARMRLDWIDGESAPREFGAGQTAPAGAFHASDSAIVARCLTDFAESPLVDLLTPNDARTDGPGHLGDGIARLYVGAVLGLAAAGFLYWWSVGTLGDAVSVSTAVLVVTCPCAFGIAAPLAHELVRARLQQAGLFARTTSLLSNAAAVTRVVFDKTGTLTTGTPQLASVASLAALNDGERAALLKLATQSTHPKSRAVVDALAQVGGRVLVSNDGDSVVQEAAGCGVQTRVDGRLHRLGRPDWAAPEHELPESDLVYAIDGRPAAVMQTRETARPDAAEEIRRLEAAGYETWILSGDQTAKVRALAASLGVPADRAIGDASPEGKASWLAAHGPEQTLFVGDGINDSLAADVALVSGTPAVDRPFMAARSDFYFVTAGLEPIRAVLAASHRLRRVVRADLAFALTYNAGAVALALVGLVEPWVAAILMPLSSVATLVGTSAALARRPT
ncbi:MAG: heavy metal translocating P-type ATPase metal-binding domain-containing protein [Sandaracinaceae bacterium]